MKHLKFIVKIIAAGAISAVIVSLLLCFYNISPVHIANPAGNTDYVWPPNSRWVHANEGIAWGKFDAQGYNNPAVVDNPDILLVGSSNLEATGVLQNQNIGALLSKKLSGIYTVYNMGMSAHDFYRVCGHLQDSLELYETSPQAIVIETTTVFVSSERAQAIISGNVSFLPSYASGVIGTFQKIPVFRTLYQQVIHGLPNVFSPSRPAYGEKLFDVYHSSAPEPRTASTADRDAYDLLFSYLGSLEEHYGTQILIFYHPTGEFDSDGSMQFYRGDSFNAFAEAAEKYGITFIDLTASFEKMYLEDHHTPHGFVTGALESGHLNRYGHAAAAEEVYRAIMELREEGLLCS